MGFHEQSRICIPLFLSYGIDPGNECSIVFDSTGPRVRQSGFIFTQNIFSWVALGIFLSSLCLNFLLSK